MRTLRFRLSADRDRTAAMLALVHEMDAVDRVEEVADQMHRRDDESSLGLSDDAVGGTDFHDIEVHARSAEAAEDAHGRIERAARELGVAVEFVETF